MTSNAQSGTTGRFLVLAGGLAGAGGVALSAAAAHADGAFTGIAATFLLAHAPVLLATGLCPASRVLRAGSLVVLAGLVLFCGDLLARDAIGTRLFPFAAPAGGTLLMLGWLIIAASALIAPSDRR